MRSYMLAIASLALQAAAQEVGGGFIGAYNKSGLQPQVTCGGGGIYHTSGTIGMCCRNPECRAITECSGSTVYYNNAAGPNRCASGSMCYSLSVYSTSPVAEGDSPQTYMFCAANWTIESIYRTLDRVSAGPAPTPTYTEAEAITTTTTDPAGRTGDAKTSPTSNIPANTGAADPDGKDDDSDSNSDDDNLSTDPVDAGPNNTDSNDSKSSNNNSNNSNQSTPNSMAWIAAPIMGGVLGAAILGGLGFWLGRRHRKKGTAAASEGAANPSPTSDTEMAMAGAPPPTGYSPAYTKSPSSYYRQQGNAANVSPALWGTSGTFAPKYPPQYPVSELPSGMPAEMSAREDIPQELDGQSQPPQAAALNPQPPQ